MRLYKKRRAASACAEGGPQTLETLGGLGTMKIFDPAHQQAPEESAIGYSEGGAPPWR
jgi:hypothetical protein